MKYIFATLTLLIAFCHSAAQSNNSYTTPFSTNDSSLTIWNGSEYIPFFMKGVNLGVAIPGTFPGEMAATRSDYSRWFTQIKDAGFNCIRLYTLHYPRFYEVLDSFNNANPQNPLYFLQGVWLEEELPGYHHDLYFLTPFFTQEIEDNIDCLHGNKTLGHRFGKAYGTYSTDVSRWCMAILVGREVYPIEVLTTNDSNATVNSFTGDHFAIQNASPAEAWFTGMLDHTVDYQFSNYGTQRPVANSSWPTLDPIEHWEEPNFEEDTAWLDFSKMQLIDAPAGFFISYHAYPYYPDFVSQQSDYKDYSDDIGPNSYLGYLTELKSHYSHFPLIIAEYGVPSSWAVAHYASSGMNHGGFDDYNQGLTNLRLLQNIKDVGCGGGIQFAWIDEWFKKTWITDHLDYIPDSRILWSNMAAAEQNYGLISYKMVNAVDTLIAEDPVKKITYLHSEVNTSYLEFEIGLKAPLSIPDELWVTLDTYSDSLGEIILPTGDTIPSGSEFVLSITNYSATLMVTEAYDVFGIWHGFSKPEQVYHSTATQGKPWKIVRVRNNSSFSDVQYIGDLQVNHGFQPISSKDAVIIYDDKIRVRLPWFYINFVAPDQMRVFNDNRAIPGKQDTISDGVMVSVLYRDEWHTPASRLVWPGWTSIPDSLLKEEFKASYYLMKDNLGKFNTPAIAFRDSFYFPGPVFPVFVDPLEGALVNDLDMDGGSLSSLLIKNAKNGLVSLYNDGSFDYTPKPGFIGYDSFEYCVYDGQALSTPNTVVLFIENNNSLELVDISPGSILVFPNPAESAITVSYSRNISQIQVFGMDGRLIDQVSGNIETYRLSVETYPVGEYIVVAKTEHGFLSERFTKR